MLTCFNVKKTHYFSNTVQYCRSSMPRLSQMLRFPQSSSFRQAQSALIIKINVKTVNNVLSFTIISSPRGEQSRVTDTVMMFVCICKQDDF